MNIFLVLADGWADNSTAVPFSAEVIQPRFPKTSWLGTSMKTMPSCYSVDHVQLCKGDHASHQGFGMWATDIQGLTCSQDQEGRYEMALELLGERNERIDQLEDDIRDMKHIFHVQLEGLVEQLAHAQRCQQDT